MRKKIGETHFYCGFCGKLFSDEDLDALTGKHALSERRIYEADAEMVKAFSDTMKSVIDETTHEATVGNPIVIRKDFTTYTPLDNKKRA